MTQKWLQGTFMFIKAWEEIIESCEMFLAPQDGPLCVSMH